MCIQYVLYVRCTCDFYYYYYGQTDRQIDCILCFDVSESEKWSMAATAARSSWDNLSHGSFAVGEICVNEKSDSEMWHTKATLMA